MSTKNTSRPPTTVRNTMLGVLVVVVGLVVLVAVIVGVVQGIAGALQTQRDHPPTTSVTATPAHHAHPTGGTPKPSATPIVYQTMKSFTGADSTTTAAMLATPGSRVVWTASPSTESNLFIVHTFYTDGDVSLPGPFVSASTFPSHGTFTLDKTGSLGTLVYFKVFASGVEWTLTLQTPSPPR